MNVPTRLDVFGWQKWQMLLLHLLAHFAILASEKQQRLALPHHHIFDLGNKDCMVPSLFRRAQTTLQICQGSLQHGSSVWSALKARPGFNLGVLVDALRTRVILRNRPLILAQHIDSESL